MGVLLAAYSLGLAAACSLNPDGSCAAPEVSTCIGQCSRRQLNTSCLSVPGCSWNSSAATRCHPTDPTVNAMCANQVRSADCGATSGCYWSTQQCPTTQVCAPVDSTTIPDPCAGAGSNAGSCATLGSQCQMKPKCISSCYAHGDEAGCTSLAGCFWTTLVTYSNGTGVNSKGCQNCLYDPETNYFLLFQYLVGKACTASSGNRTNVVNILRVTPAATGCSGGDPFPVNRLEVVCTGAAASAGLTEATSFLLVVIFFAIN